MTEKEKNILDQELGELVSLSFEAANRYFGILEKMFECVLREDPDEMTPGKRKVIEEIRLHRRFVKTLREDIGKIAARLGKEKIVPAGPGLTVSDDLWTIGKSGTSDALFEVSDRMDIFQSALQDCASDLPEVCR